MKPNIKQLSLSACTRPGIRAGFIGPFFVQPALLGLGHLRWSAALGSKYGLRKRNYGVGAESLVYLLLGRSRLIVTQHSEPRIQFNSRNVLQNIFSLNFSSTAQLIARERINTRYVHLRSDSHMSRELASPVANNISVASEHYSKTVNLPAAKPRIESHPEAGAQPRIFSGVRLANNRAHVRPLRSRFEIISEENGAEAGAKQILRKVRRIDADLRSIRQDFVVNSNASPSRTSTIEKTQHQSEWPSDAKSMSAKSFAPLQSGLDVTRIADEVMQQLDRRFIAARERIGKI
jgi:hypothetical protein